MIAVRALAWSLCGDMSNKPEDAYLVERQRAGLVDSSKNLGNSHILSVADNATSASGTVVQYTELLSRALVTPGFSIV